MAVSDGGKAGAALGHGATGYVRYITTEGAIVDDGPNVQVVHMHGTTRPVASAKVFCPSGVVDKHGVGDADKARPICGDCPTIALPVDVPFKRAVVNIRPGYRVAQP